MAMTGTFRAAVKTYHGDNRIFPPVSAPILETQKHPLLMYHRKEKGGEKREAEKKLKCLNRSKDKVKQHAGVLLGVFPLNNAKTF